MIDREKVIKGLETCIPMKYETNEEKECRHEQCPYVRENYKPMNGCFWDLMSDALELLKEQDAKQYNNHEVACIIADLFGDPCACNFNDIDTWLPYKCDFRETCCPNPVGVACWEQYLKHRKGR
jgi:hypothetical protein